MDRLPPNTSLPRRMPSPFERTTRFLSKIANRLPGYRNNSLLQALQTFLRRLRQHHRQHATEETPVSIFEAIQRRVASFQRSQGANERATDGHVVVNIGTSFTRPDGGMTRFFVEIRVPTNGRITAISSRDIIQIRFLENENQPGSGVADDPDSSHYPRLYLQDHRFYEHYLPFWVLLYAIRRRDGEDTAPVARFPEMLSGVRNEDEVVVDDIGTGEFIGGATEEEIARLPHSKATEEHVDQTCRICLEQFESNTPMTTLPCGHIFHPSCIRSWLLRNSSCPIDRRTIFVDS